MSNGHPVECKCEEMWGRQSPDCQGTFYISRRWEAYYCPPCKQVAKSQRNKQYKTQRKQEGAMCTNCGLEVIKKGNRFLCPRCFARSACLYDLQVIPDIPDWQGVYCYIQHEPVPEHSDVVTYNSHDYTQEQLKALVPSG